HMFLVPAAPYSSLYNTLFFLHYYADHRDLHSFPTRRSSDLGSQPDRGLAYWSDGQDKRILVGVMNFLYALDASTGQPIPGFAKQGRIDLREDLGRTPATAQSIDLTSPGIVYRDLIIVGGRDRKSVV